MAEDTTVTIAIKANIEGFKKSMAEAKKAVKGAGKSMTEDAQNMSKSVEDAGKKGRFAQLAESLKGVSPMFDGLAGSVSGIGDRLKGMGKAGKLAIAGIAVAVAGLAAGLVVKLGKAIMDTTGKFAAMADPVRFDKATSEMRESIRSLKTAIGETAAPIYEWMTKAVKALADGLKWVVEKVAAFVGILQGLLGWGRKANQTLKGTAEGMEEAGIAADAGLASFDKLNTLNIGELGDMEQAERMSAIMEDARRKGAELADKMREAVKPVRDVVEKVRGLFNMDPSRVWHDFTVSAGNAWDSIKGWASDTWQGIRDSMRGTWDGMVGWASEAWDGIKAKAGEIWDGIKGWASGLWNGFTGWASEAWENVRTKAHEVWDDVKAWILDKFHAVGESLRGMFSGVVGAFRAAWDRVFGAIQGAIKWITDKIDWLMDKIHGIKDSIGNFGQKVSGAVGGFVDNVKGVLGFAKGGVFQPNSPQLVMVGDNKSEPEVIAPRSMIMDAMRAVIAETGGMNRRQEDITLTIDGKTLARYVYNDLVQEGVRNGRGTIA